MIKYEDLNGNDADSLKVKDDLRTFLNLGKDSYIQKSKTNSTGDWVRALDWKMLEIVDAVCVNVYQKLGYSKIDYQTWLDSS